MPCHCLALSERRWLSAREHPIPGPKPRGDRPLYIAVLPCTVGIVTTMVNRDTKGGLQQAEVTVGVIKF